MAGSAGRRRFGNVRQRASGRWQARFPGPDGRMRSAPETFERKSDAQRYLSIVEAQMAHGEWMDPKRAQIRLQDYTERWIAHRANLRPRTVELYRWVLKRHVTPYLGGVPLSRLDPPMVKEWRASLLASGVSPNAAAKAYRLLRAVLMTAVNEDRILPRNPCRIPGADRESPAERPVLALPQVVELADLVPRRYRAMILVATFASLRYGEAIALRRADVDVGRMSIRVVQAYTEIRGRGMVLGPPKSRAGVRTIAVPALVADALREHLTEFVRDEARALVFTGPTGAPFRRGNFNKLVKWAEALEAIGAPGLHFHDLRHTGNTLAAQSKTSTRDLMTRMGHDSIAGRI